MDEWQAETLANTSLVTMYRDVTRPDGRQVRLTITPDGDGKHHYRAGAIWDGRYFIASELLETLEAAKTWAQRAVGDWGRDQIAAVKAAAKERQAARYAAAMEPRVRLDGALTVRLREQAEQEQVSLTTLVNRLLTEVVGGHLVKAVAKEQADDGAEGAAAGR